MGWEGRFAPLAGALLIVLGACTSTASSPAGDAGAPDSGATRADGGPPGADAAVTVGAPCDYVCGGLACDQACDGNRLLRCTPQGAWTLDQDCAASGETCALSLVDGGPDAVRSCQGGVDAGACPSTVPLPPGVPTTTGPDCSSQGLSCSFGGGCECTCAPQSGAGPGAYAWSCTPACTCMQGGCNEAGAMDAPAE
jgi:hypothetical protein